MTYSELANIADARARRKAGPPPAPPEDRRQDIQLGHDLHRVVDEAIAALANHPDVYQRDGELVRIIRCEEPDAGGTVLGTPLIRPVVLPTLREMLTRVARFVRWNSQKEAFSETSVDKHTVAAVLARGEWPRVRPLVGITETPCLRHDGSLLLEPGYDARTGLVHIPSLEVAAIEDAPSQATSMNALLRLKAPFVDFPFASEVGQYVPVAAVLTMVARYAIDGSVPMMVADASTRGSGKSLLMDAVAIIATGRGAPRMTYPPNEEELEKTLAACALFGSRIIGLDNISSTLGAAPLDKVLTAEDKVALRVLGKSEIRELRWRALIMASGNNIVLGADTSRRSLIARLEPAVERPEERTGFAFPNLLSHLRTARAGLIADALTVLRGYVAAGCPGGAEQTWGSFASWSRLVAGAIVWAGGKSPLGARAVSLGSSEPEAEALRTILAMLPTFAPDGVSSRDLVARLWPPHDRREGPRAPDGYDGLRDAFETIAPPKRAGDAPSPLSIGKALRRFVGRVVSGRRLVNRQEHKGVLVWQSAEVPHGQTAFQT